MKKILLFFMLSALIFKKSEALSVPIQSLFFVYSLKESAFLTKRNVSDAKPVKSVLFMLCGLALSELLLLYSGWQTFINSSLISIDVFSQYLLFYSVLTFMYLNGKSKKSLRFSLIVFTLFPAFSLFSKFSSIAFTLTLLSFSAVAVYASALYTKKKRGVR